MLQNRLKRFNFGIKKLNLLVLFLFCFIIFGELCFGWIESLVGHYLLHGNAKRPESGLAWEIEHKKQIANNNLIQLVNNRFSIENGSVSFSNIIVNLSNGKEVMISAVDFMDFYNQLPINNVNKIFSPYIILNVLSQGNWTHTYFKKIGNEIIIYLLDENNLILAKNNIHQKSIDFASLTKPIFNGRLNSLPNFKNNIYSADIFFSELIKLSDNLQKEIISLPEKLLKINGKILKVGISNKIHLDTTEIAIEVKNIQGYRVFFFHGKTKSIYNIKTELEKVSKSIDSLK